MKKTTRKSFSRKAIVVVMSVFLTISLTAVGFASWLISSNDSKEGTGNVNASNVSDAILGVTIENATDLGTINFGPLKDDTEGNVQYDKNQADDFASLEVTVSGSIDNYKTLATMYITVKCPDSVLTAAGYTWNAEGETRTYTYNIDKAYIALPTCAVDTKGNYLPLPAGGESKTAPMEFANGNEVFKGTDENKKDFTTTISFKWGALFEGNNPGKYLDAEDGLSVSPENKNALLAIAKAQNAGANYTDELTAEAKRDILKAMKVAITGANSYEDAVTAAAPKFTVVVNAKAK